MTQSALTFETPVSGEQKIRVLQMLRRGPCTTADFLSAYIPRFSARLNDLRKAGYQIRTTRIRKGSFLYTLQGPE